METNAASVADKSQVAAEVAENVRNAIEAAERTISWVARKADIPRNTLSRKLNGHVDFTVAELARIAKALGVSPTGLLPRIFTDALATAA